MESLFIEIIRSHERNVIVGIIYRPPNQNVNDFVIRMNDVLGKVTLIIDDDDNDDDDDDSFDRRLNTGKAL